MTPWDAVRILWELVWLPAGAYLAVAMVMSYLAPIYAPEDWAREAKAMAAWVWPLGIICILHGRLYLAGVRARALRDGQDHAMVIMKTRPDLGSDGRDYSSQKWHEYDDQARGLVVRWRSKKD